MSLPHKWQILRMNASFLVCILLFAKDVTTEKDISKTSSHEICCRYSCDYMIKYIYNNNIMVPA